MKSPLFLAAFVLTAPLAQAAQYQCTGQLSETVPVFSVEYKNDFGTNTDVSRGVPAEIAGKRVDYNAYLFDGDYSKLTWSAATYPGANGSNMRVIYAKAVKGNPESFVVDTVCAAKATKCVLLVTQGNAQAPIAVLTTNQSADRRLPFAAGLMGSVQFQRDGNALSVTSVVVKSYGMDEGGANGRSATGIPYGQKSFSISQEASEVAYYEIDQSASFPSSISVSCKLAK
jgi:hypothetical protein